MLTSEYKKKNVPAVSGISRKHGDTNLVILNPAHENLVRVKIYRGRGGGPAGPVERDRRFPVAFTGDLQQKSGTCQHFEKKRIKTNPNVQNEREKRIKTKKSNYLEFLAFQS